MFVIQQVIKKTVCSVGIILLSQCFVACDGDVNNIVQGQQAEQAGIQSITLSTNKAVIALNESLQINVQAVTSNSNNEDYTSQIDQWTVSDSAVATISSEGILTGLSVGTTTVSAQFANFSASLDIVVSDAELQSLALSRIDDSGQGPDVCRPFSMSATGSYSDGTMRVDTDRVSWSASASTAGSLGAGQFIFRDTDTTTITASIGAVAAETNVTAVEANFTAITISPATPSVNAGSTLHLNAFGTFSGESVDLSNYVNWSLVMASGAASIDQSGLLTGTTEGQGTVSATCSVQSHNQSLTVIAAATVASTRINNAGAGVSINVGGETDLVAWAVYSDGREVDVTSDSNTVWSISSDPSSAISLITDVNNNNVGRVTGEGSGTAFVRIEFSGFNSVIEIDVQ